MLENNISEEQPLASRRLAEFPDWGYLLREFYEAYRFLSSGGSDKIRAHQRAVREAIGRVLKSDPEMRFDAPAHKPVTAHLRRALDEGKQERTAPLVRAIESVRDHLIWQYGYEKVPRGLDKTYAYAEICGPNGPVLTTDVILGLVLFAPGCTYPAHAHSGISESYICVSGSVSENHQGVYAPGSMIFNPPEHMHRITVSKLEPALLAWAWIGPSERLANQKMVFSRKKG
ncbi:Dimethlysulfonioproprionate lyase DddL [Labrenzia sp. THAF191b]|uniref:dimethylsulfonioproprionate lyase family protein n=1 Tax=unclassified Labrenzia TaxID=2648686 RepID=UPI0012687FCA|nr:MULTISPECIES: dimethylsulfonioproprionate lyase family protein [unclassified Labrenzia]QFS98613.1 Dimethlysulfonioproprionate lyase DddL [Labrenzia sp. THAF191b]QFT04927.1 Dimethlysulfonioproprionate lyase DddL [Labrenzia sp. THAF191a]QFT16471.1 Dimethlysulfonioproprionate lyase DddL [Labrenzia sp. THAF187b]